MTTLIGPCALEWNGLIAWYANAYMLTTSQQSLDKANVYNCVLMFMLDVEEDSKYIRGSTHTIYDEARIPTVERALVDYVRHMDVLEEEHICNGLEEYWHQHHGDLRYLRQIAAEYGATKELELWISRTDIPEWERNGLK